MDTSIEAFVRMVGVPGVSTDALLLLVDAMFAKGKGNDCLDLDDGELVCRE